MMPLSALILGMMFLSGLILRRRRRVRAMRGPMTGSDLRALFRMRPMKAVVAFAALLSLQICYILYRLPEPAAGRTGSRSRA